MIKTALLTSLAVASVAAFACIASAAPRPETSTYIDGNVSSLKPHTGGTLVFTDDKSMTFRTGLTDVAVPYASILRAELGAIQTRSHNQPAYKVWDYPERLLKTETRLLTVEFKSGSGESQSMTLELAKPAASTVLSTIQDHTAKAVTASMTKPVTTPLAKPVTAAKAAAGKPAVAAAAKQEWWGDSYWKTNRNQDSWNTKAAANADTSTNTK